ncbi:hypothetical protein C7S20_19315 [Christiangramia fulva]|uniref:Uncharacterized protein n=2 Tax=Christiangramia fulva TaxID=2126553 RepID=A0A2R3ZAA9_9FLAO|nr:hypothetical protein C7S20_19315 [Christiangramia fulva]
MPDVISGKPNHFVEKIWKSFGGVFMNQHFTMEVTQGLENACYQWNYKAGDLKPKKHTMRMDASDRWKAGKKIHMVINNRQPNRFQFVPTVPCIATQKVELKDWEYAMIDGKRLSTVELSRLAINDGFPDVFSFMHWFQGNWKGKLIHWTDLKY